MSKYPRFGLMVVNINGRYVPQAICDVCGAVIDNCRKAAVTHKHIPVEHTRGAQQVIFVHKGNCLDTIEKDLGCNGWQEMGTFLARLLHNTKFDYQVEFDREEKMSQLL